MPTAAWLKSSPLEAPVAQYSRPEGQRSALRAHRNTRLGRYPFPPALLRGPEAARFAYGALVPTPWPPPWRARPRRTGAACITSTRSVSTSRSAPYFDTFFTVSQVRVVMSLPNVFSIRVMKTGPRGPGT